MTINAFSNVYKISKIPVTPCTKHTNTHGKIKYNI